VFQFQFGLIVLKKSAQVNRLEISPVFCPLMGSVFANALMMMVANTVITTEICLTWSFIIIFLGDKPPAERFHARLHDRR
jgi:hypothetical protein